VNKKKNIFSFIEEKQEMEFKCSSQSQNLEIQEYLKSPCLEQQDNPLEYWKNNQHSFLIWLS
jgi:hypothetical protein